MNDRSRFPEEIDAVPDRGSPPRMPRWVKWSLIVIGILLLLLLVVLPLVGVQHDPGMHSAGDPAPVVATSGELR
jgi:cytochrome b561